MQLGGIHHLTAISAKPRENLAFYTGLLGMRLVKKTVNQDDVSAYHLFYADGKANPGTDLTFFDFPAAPEQRGTNSISRTGLRVAGEASLGYWRDRLKKSGGVAGDVVEVDGRLTLPFEDGEGPAAGAGRRRRHWRGLAMGTQPGAGRASDPRPGSDRADRAGAVAHRLRADRGHEHAPRARLCRPRRADPCVRDGRGGGEGGPAAELHVLEDKDAPIARQGAGGVHHVAFRTPDEAQYHAWTQRLNELRVPNSGEVDRFYFRSLYFREPNGILFEIATDGPGFATDEPMETLGEKLALPPFLEPRRAAIEAGLKPIV